MESASRPAAAGGFAVTTQRVSSPAAPTGLTVTSEPAIAVLTLSWTDNSSDETGFSIWRRHGTAPWTRIAVAAANTTTYRDNGLDAYTIQRGDRGLTPNTTYTYRVRAHHDTAASAWSNEASGRTPNVPAAPSSLRAGVVSDTVIGLWWSDRVATETGFSIWRKSEPGDWIRIGVLPARERVFDDVTANPNTQYAYRVRAFNDVGVSAWSNEAAVVSLPVASIHLSVPAIAPRSGSTRAHVAYILPAGYTLFHLLRVVVVSPPHSMYAHAPARVTQPPPVGSGYDDLNTDIYYPGAYWVRAEIDYQSPDGQNGTAMSSWSPMTVPPAYPARLLVPPALRPNSQAAATVELTRQHRVPGFQPLVVALTSSHPDLVRVPASVSVERSARSAAFTISTAPTDRPTTVTISASANGETISAPLTVSPF